MHSERFFDQTAALIEIGEIPTALSLLAGKLYNAQADAVTWPETRAALHRHRLHGLLLEDPYIAHCVAKPRGYPGDAGLIDLIYDRTVPGDASPLGSELFKVTIKFQAAEAVRMRREHAQKVVEAAWQSGKSICSLAGGYWREGDNLNGYDTSNVTVVDQDAQSLAVVRQRHGKDINLSEANVFNFLRAAASRNEQFDLIYTLGLTDYLDARAMRLLHRLMKACLAPGGTILLANFVPNHLATGWMDAVMDWHLIYRDEAELESYAREVGLVPRSWRDPTGSVAWCEMSDSE